MTNQEKIQECLAKIEEQEKKLKRLQKTYQFGDVLYNPAFKDDTKVIVRTGHRYDRITFYCPSTNCDWHGGESYKVKDVCNITREELDKTAGECWDTKDE